MAFLGCKLSGVIEWHGNKIKSNQYRAWMGWLSGLDEAVFGESTVRMIARDNIINGSRSWFRFNPFNSSDSGSLHLINNLPIDAFDDAAIAATGDFYTFRQDLKASPGMPYPMVELKSNVALGDSPAGAFKIVLDSGSSDAAVVVNVAWIANDFSSSSGFIQFTALNNDGAWTIGAVTSSMTNASAPTASVVGSDIIISGNKAGGGVPSAPTIIGMVAGANCTISSV
jgi:hypothetical protein